MKIIRHFSRATQYALISCLVATALALSVIRFWLLPKAIAYRGDLETRIGAMIDETVLIHGLSARMHGLDPEVVLKDFEIIDAARVRAPLRFRQVRVDFSLVRSLMAGAPVLRGIRLVGASLTLQRNQDGTIGVLGLKASEHVPAWLFADRAVELRDIELEWRDLQAGGARLSLGHTDIVLRNEADRHQLSASLALTSELGDSLRMAADVEGDIFDRTAWRGRIYLEGRNIREGLLGDILTIPVKLKSGAASFKLWGDWQDGAISQVVGQLDLAKPLIAYMGEAGGESLLALNQVGGLFRWQREDRGWRLDMKHFMLSRDHQPWPETQFSIAVEEDADGHMTALRAAASYFRFDDARVLLDAVPVLDKTDQDALRGLSPRGEAKDVRLVYAPAAALGERWALCGVLGEADFSAWRGIPGLDHINGRICGNDQQGRIRFSAENAQLNAAKLFKKPIRLQAFEGAVDWRQTDEEWRIASSRLKLAAPGLEALARFEFKLPKAEGASPFLDLQARLANVDAGLLRDYLPFAAMPETSAVWLEGAFAAGRVREASVLLHGLLADFPFVHSEGVFEALADVENVELHYDPEWPHLYGVNASLRFYGAGLFIDASGGRIGEAPIKTAHAEAPDLVRDPWSTVTGEIETNVPQCMKFLQQTPLRHIPERLLKVIDPSGETAIALNLKIPLVKGLGQVEVDGSARLDNAALAVTGLNLDVRHISGSLHFTQDGLDAQDLKAVMLGEAAKIDVAQAGDDILIETAGRTSVPILRKAFPASFWTYAEGALGYRLSLRIPESMDSASDPLRMTFTSDLLGLGVKLPAPLGKTDQSKRDIKADLVLQAGSQTSMRLLYGEEVRAQLVLSEPAAGFKLESGDLTLRRPLPALSMEPGLRLYADLDELDLKPWQKLLAEGDGGERLGPILRVLDFDVARLGWNGEDLGHLSLVGRRKDNEWSGTLDSAFGKGRFSALIPEFGRPSLRLDLDYLKLPKLSAEKLEYVHGASPDPSAIPALQISSKQLLWQENDLGGFELETERWTQGMNIKKLTVQKANHQLSLRGSWMRLEGRDETRTEGRVNIKDMGEFVSGLGFAEEIRDTPSEADFSLAWQGAPHQFSAGSVAGDIKMKLGRGAILKMEPGMGRALGVLNLHTLRRLLLLDFSDLFGKGLAYDSMEGRFHLGGGQAQTSGFAIDAVAAKILISGRIGLVARDFDEIVAVIPHTLASLPIAGALVGGAAVDAAISVAQKLFGKESASIASTNYAVKGSWDDPQITRIGGYMPLDMLERAWSGVKDLSGFGVNEEDNRNE